MVRHGKTCQKLHSFGKFREKGLVGIAERHIPARNDSSRKEQIRQSLEPTRGRLCVIFVAL